MPVVLSESILCLRVSTPKSWNPLGTRHLLPVLMVRSLGSLHFFFFFLFQALCLLREKSLYLNRALHFPVVLFLSITISSFVLFLAAFIYDSHRLQTAEVEELFFCDLHF